MKRISRRRFVAIGAVSLGAALTRSLPARRGTARAGPDVSLFGAPRGREETAPILPVTPTSGVAAAPMAFEFATAAVATSTAVPTQSGALRMPPPEWPPEVLRQVARSGGAERPLVGLTIDDGWSHRDATLDALKARKVQPTFFLTGRALAGDYGFIARSLDAGCEVANHTMDHFNLTDKSVEYVRKDLQDFENLVRAVVNQATTRPYMRPSGGSLNQTVINASADAGYRPVLWSVSTGDGSSSTTPAQMVANALAGARPGAIILMHFGPRAPAALPGLIDGLRAKGLEPVSLTRLFGGA